MSKKHNWTPEEIEWLKANYATSGRKAASEYLGVSRQIAGNKARQLGIVTNRGRRHAHRKRSFNEPAICQAYRECGDRKQVAKLFDTHVDRISEIVKRHGIEVKLKSRFRDHQEAIIKDYQANELNMKELAAKYGLSDDRIREGLTKLGLYDEKRRLLFIEGRDIMAIWTAKYGADEAENRRNAWKAKLSETSRGENNNMYGRPTPQGAGNGWKGWYRGQYFRSLREVAFMIDADVKGLTWTPGERKEFTIRYESGGSQRTYRPDFRIGDVLYEIKPIKLHATPSVTAKAEAARRFCAERGWRYELIDVEIKPDLLKAAYERGDIRFDRDYEARFLAYLAPTE